MIHLPRKKKREKKATLVCANAHRPQQNARYPRNSSFTHTVPFAYIVRNLRDSHSLWCCCFVWSIIIERSHFYARAYTLTSSEQRKFHDHSRVGCRYRSTTIYQSHNPTVTIHKHTHHAQHTHTHHPMRDNVFVNNISTRLDVEMKRRRRRRVSETAVSRETTADSNSIFTWKYSKYFVHKFS